MVVVSACGIDIAGLEVSPSPMSHVKSNATHVVPEESDVFLDPDMAS